MISYLRYQDGVIQKYPKNFIKTMLKQLCFVLINKENKQITSKSAHKAVS